MFRTDHNPFRRVRTMRRDKHDFSNCLSGAAALAELLNRFNRLNVNPIGMRNAAVRSFSRELFLFRSLLKSLSKWLSSCSSAVFPRARGCLRVLRVSWAILSHYQSLFSHANPGELPGRALRKQFGAVCRDYLNLQIEDLNRNVYIRSVCRLRAPVAEHRT